MADQKPQMPRGPACAAGTEPERHLQQLASAGARGSEEEEEAARQAIEQDLHAHFMSAGQQMEGDAGPR